LPRATPGSSPAIGVTSRFLIISGDELPNARTVLDAAVHFRERHKIAVTHKEIDELKSLTDEIANFLIKQRVVNERNIKSVQKAEDFIRDSINHLKAAPSRAWVVDRSVPSVSSDSLQYLSSQLTSQSQMGQSA